MDFPGQVGLAPIIAEMRYLGVGQDCLAKMLWVALGRVNAQGGLSLDDFKVVFKLWYNEEHPTEVQAAKRFSQAFILYQQMLNNPLSIPQPLLTQALLEYCLSELLGITQPQKLLFAGMEQQLTAPEQQPYFELLSVLFGPKGFQGLERTYAVEDIEDYVRAVELGRMPEPDNYLALAKGLLESFQRQHGLSTQWSEQLIPAVDSHVDSWSYERRLVLRLRFGLSGQRQATKRQIGNLCNLSEKTVEDWLAGLYTNLRQARAVAQLVPPLAAHG